MEVEVEGGIDEDVVDEAVNPPAAAAAEVVAALAFKFFLNPLAKATAPAQAYKLDINN